MWEYVNVKMTGHIKIVEKETGKILLDQMNAIHPENMALSLTQSLGNKVTQGPIKSMVFGNGAAYVNGIGSITYLSKNITGSNSQLYSQTYFKVVDNTSLDNIDPTNNQMNWTHVDGNLFSDLIITATLSPNEPVDQNVLNNSTNLTGKFIFNELGLLNYSGKLLTHAIFSPVEKASNVSLVITYTLRVSLV